MFREIEIIRIQYGFCFSIQSGPSYQGEQEALYDEHQA